MLIRNKYLTELVLTLQYYKYILKEVLTAELFYSAARDFVCFFPYVNKLKLIELTFNCLKAFYI